MGKQNALAGIIGQRETAVIGAVVDEITAKPAEQFFLKLLPPVARPEYLVYHEKVSGFGGVLGERQLGEAGKNGDASSSEVIEFSPGAYQEGKRFTEKDLIMLRRLGSIGERGATGISSGALDFLSRAGEDLKVKLNNRLNKLAADAIFTGAYTYQGVTKYNFNPPSANTVAAATDWSDFANSKPFTDLFTIVNKNAVYRKYVIKQLVINPVTAANMLMSLEARDLIKNNSAAAGDVNKLAQIMYPGLPEIYICKDAYQDSSTVNGRIVLGNAQFFMPDNKVLALIDMGGTLYGQYGEIQMTYNINDPSATIESPAIGVYSFVDEKGLSERRAPHVEIVTGFNGGPNLMRSNDVLIITTV